MMDLTDGVSVTFTRDEISHLRPAGKAPEQRCHTEAGCPVQAEEILGSAQAIIRS